MIFNTEWGYLEALTRGFKNGMLKHSDYLNLTQCDSLEDVMISIQGTDYGIIFGGENKEPCVEVIERALRDRLPIGKNISHAMIFVFLGESCMCWKRISAVTCPSDYDVLA